MAENATLPADGLLVSTDELATLNGQAAPAGLQVQRAKMGFGPDGELKDVSEDDPLPVALQGTVPISASSLPLPAGAATDIGLAAIVAAINANGGGGGGSVAVSNFPATQAISAAALPLPAGAATAAGVAAIVTALGTPAQAGATQPISAAALPLPAGAATAAGVAAVVTALGTPLQAGGTVALDAPTLAALENVTATISGPVALDSATLAALENVNATVSGTVGLDGPALAALENTGVTLEALVFPASTNNSSVDQLQPNATFVGVIETVQNLQAAQVQVVCDQPYTLVINQYIDAAGLELTESTTFRRAANQPLCLNVLLPGNFFNLALTNNGIQETEALHIDVTFGIMDTLPKTLGQKTRDESMAVALSSDDVDLLNDIRNALAPLMSARGVDGALRITALGGTLAISSLPTLGTVTTVATVSNVANQTSMGAFQANPQIPALMNLAAASNIDRMVG